MTPWQCLVMTDSEQGMTDQLAHSCCEMEDLKALPTKVFATRVLSDEIRRQDRSYQLGRFHSSAETKIG